MEKMDKMHTENMSKLTTTMETLSNSIATAALVFVFFDKLSWKAQLVRNLTGIKPPKWTNKTSDPKQPSSYVCIPPF